MPIPTPTPAISAEEKVGFGGSNSEGSAEGSPVADAEADDEADDEDVGEGVDSESAGVPVVTAEAVAEDSWAGLRIISVALLDILNSPAAVAAADTADDCDSPAAATFVACIASAPFVHSPDSQANHDQISPPQGIIA